MGQPFGFTQLTIFKFGVPILFLVSLRLKPKRQVVNVWLNALLGLALITTFLLKDQPYLIALEPLILVFLGITAYYTLSNYLDDITPILNGICWVIGIQAIIVALQAMGLDPICVREDGSHNTHLVGLFGAKYVFGAWMALATPILLFNKRKFFAILSAILCICSFSWASIGLMILAVMIGACMLDKKWWIISVLTLIVCGTLIYVKCQTPFYMADYGLEHNFKRASLKTLHPMSLQYKIKSRIDTQTKFLPILGAKPIGYGLGCFKYIGPQVINKNMGYGTMRDAWNDWLERSIEMGFLFILLFGMLCFTTSRKFQTMAPTMSNIGIFCSLLLIPTSMLFHDILNHASLNTLMLSIFSCFAIRGDYEKKHS